MVPTFLRDALALAVSATTLWLTFLRPLLYSTLNAAWSFKAYDTEDFVNELRSMRVTPHVAQNTGGRRSSIDGRTTRHAGYKIGQRIRKRIEEAFGWIKTIAGQAKTSFKGLDRVERAFTFAASAYNPVRLPKLLVEAA